MLDSEDHSATLLKYSHQYIEAEDLTVPSLMVQPCDEADCNIDYAFKPLTFEIRA